DFKNINKQEVVSIIESMSTKYAVKDMLDFLGISKTSYYRWKKHIHRKDVALVELIQSICIKHKFRYGYRRVTAELRWKHNQIVNHKKVQRIMKENKLCAKIRKKKFSFFRQQEALKKVDLIQRQFQATKPNEKWFTDVSELPFGEKKLYFSAIIDGYNNEILSSAISTSPNLDLAFETLNKALETKEVNGVILHSDQGSIYTSPKFQSYVKKKNIIQSMSAKGVCYDNVLIESFFSHLKTEVFYSQDFTATNEQIIELVEEYIYYYNNER
ncbi:IS3 family transposase, partial [Listeria welshimeri]|nr:IS3 family transposase [Listeria welshimeri]